MISDIDLFKTQVLEDMYNIPYSNKYAPTTYTLKLMATPHNI